MAYKNLVITPTKYPSQATLKSSQFYKGFSTVNNNRNVTLFDSDLIKQDIINHFNTKRGERLMNPTFGTIIWDLLFDPMTDTLKDNIQTDITNILNSEPRIAPLSVNVDTKDYGILVEITMQYVEVDQIDSLVLSFDKNTRAVV